MSVFAYCSHFTTVYICMCMQTKSDHFGSIPIQVETPCVKLGMTKGKFRWHVKTYAQYKELIPFHLWYNKNKKNPKFKHLLAVALRNWKGLDYINNKVVKNKATSLGPPPAGPQVEREKCR